MTPDNPRELIAVSVTHTRVLVNAGDHAQDVMTAVEVGYDETVTEVAERLLRTQGYRRFTPEYEDYLTIRLVKPREEPER